MEAQRQTNDKLLAESSSLPKKVKLSKRAQKKLDKQMADKNISDLEKQIIKDQAMNGEIAGQNCGSKRQKLDSFRDKKNFITGDR